MSSEKDRLKDRIEELTAKLKEVEDSRFNALKFFDERDKKRRNRITDLETALEEMEKMINSIIIAVADTYGTGKRTKKLVFTRPQVDKEHEFLVKTEINLEKNQMEVLVSKKVEQVQE